MEDFDIDGRKASNPDAREILRILDEGGYIGRSGARVSISEPQAASEKGTRLYTPEQLEQLRQGRSDLTGKPRIDIREATTSQAAHDLGSENVALLNFASARNPGGGFFSGARAQEEELCRCSGLYRTLITQPSYYRANREQSSYLYTDCLIYSPSVPFFRVSAHDP